MKFQILILIFLHSFICQAETSDSLYLQGRIQFTSKNYSEAIKYFEKSSSQTESFKIYFWLAYSYSKLENHMKCLIYLDKCEQLNFPNNSYKIAFYKLKVWAYESMNPKTIIKTVEKNTYYHFRGGLSKEIEGDENTTIRYEKVKETIKPNIPDVYFVDTIP